MARTHVVIADEVVDAMDRLVGARGRSRFLEEAAREKLARLELEAALEETSNTVSSAATPRMAQPSLDRGLGAHDATDGSILSRYLLDTTVLIAHLRGDRAVTDALLQRLGDGHSLGTTCVNIAEIERGLRPAERKKAQVLLDRLVFFDTTREAATRAGRYQADWARRRTNNSYAGRAHRRYRVRSRRSPCDRQPRRLPDARRPRRITRSRLKSRAEPGALSRYRSISSSAGSRPALRVSFRPARWSSSRACRCSESCWRVWPSGRCWSVTWCWCRYCSTDRAAASHLQRLLPSYGYGPRVAR